MRLTLFFIGFALCLAAGKTTKENKKKQSRLLQEPVSVIVEQPSQEFNVSECSQYSFSQPAILSAKPSLLGIPREIKNQEWFGRTRATLHVCHPMVDTIIGKMKNPKVNIGRLLVYLSGKQHRLEMYFNLSDLEKIDEGFKKQSAWGLVTLVTHFGSQQLPAKYAFRIEDNFTYATMTLTKGAAMSIFDSKTTQLQFTLVDDQKTRLWKVTAFVLLLTAMVIGYKNTPTEFMSAYFRRRSAALSLGALLIKIQAMAWMYASIMYETDYPWYIICLVAIFLIFHFGWWAKTIITLWRNQRKKHRTAMLIAFGILIGIEHVFCWNSSYIVISTALLVLLPRLFMVTSPENQQENAVCRRHFVCVTLIILAVQAQEFRQETDLGLCIAGFMLLVVHELLLRYYSAPKFIATAVLTSEECPICLAGILAEDLYQTECKHIFHRECLTVSFKSVGDMCPYCKSPIVDPLDHEDQ